MTQKVVSQVLASAVATSGTFTVTYPSGTNASWFKGGVQHKIAALGKEFSSPEDFGITSFGSTSCTVTWRNSITLPAGTTVRTGLDAVGGRWLDEPPVLTPQPAPNLVSEMHVQRISLGAPLVADADGLATAAGIPLYGAVTLNGAQVTSSVAYMDVPRNVTIAIPTGVTFAGATITGTDVFGATMIESLAANSGAGTDAAGVKAFDTVTSISISTVTATFQTATIGFGDVLGLPVFLPSSAHVLKELEDGASASSGTIVAGLSPNTASTASTADVRGTYDPNSAADGSKVFELLVALSDPSFKGVPQYDG